MSRTRASILTALAMAWITSACDNPPVDPGDPDAGTTEMDSGTQVNDDAGTNPGDDDAGTTDEDAGTSEEDGGTDADGGTDPDGGIDPDGGTDPDDGTDPDVCGDGVVSGTETCDPAIAAGSPGACPTSCNDGIACTTDVLMGSAGSCDATCSATPITACTAGDSCCPSGCTSETDTDCSCTPRTTCATGECGTVDDGCGGALDCGTCATGGGCDVDADCASGICVTEPSSGWPGGFCTLGCATDADCGADSHCGYIEGGSGVCVANCADDTDCRSGYTCRNDDEDSPATRECAPSGIGTAAIGEACASTADCSGGDVAFCLVQDRGWQDGYCTRTCTSDGDCGGAAHCAAIGEDGVGVCMTNCTGPTCRTPGYACHDFDGDSQTECAPAATGTGTTGSACRNTFECMGGVDGLCITNPEWVDGYCTVLDCTNDTDCTSTAGGHCSEVGAGANVCTAGCTSDADCRTPGYACYDVDGNGRNECWPAATGTGAVGSACQFTWQCSGRELGVCLNESSGFRSGYCAVFGCTPGGTDCPTGSHCISVGSANICVDDCATNADCRADGYRCFDADGAGANECWPAATGTGAVGAPCTGTWDCAGGPLGVCATDDPDTAEVEWPNGYCLLDCRSSGCPSGSTCVEASATQSWCIDNCTGTGMGDCRAGYECLALDATTNACL